MCTPNQLNKILNEVSQRAQKLLGDHLRNVILYGSYARGDYNEESDIDIMILADVHENEIRTFQRQLNILSSDLSLENNITICIMLNDKTLFNERLPILPFYQNVVNDGVQYYGA